MKVACPLQLEREHEGYRRMVEAFEDSAMVLLGLDGKIESWNAGAARITQYDAEDAVGGNYSMLYTAEARAAGDAAQDLARALRDGQYERDCLQGRKNGAVYRARVRISLLKDKHGVPTGFATVTHDLTERDVAEARFAGIVRISEDAIISMDEEQNITLFNEGAEKIFGYPVAAVIGNKLEMLIPRRFRPAHRCYIANFGGSGDVLHPMNGRGSISCLRRDGTEFPAEASIYRFEAGGEQVFTVRLRDITERVKAEEQIRNSLEEKEVLLKEIHHRVKNNLQVVSSLLSLQSGNPRAGPVRELFTESQNRVTTMALIHEKLYQSPDLSRIDFADYVGSLTGNLFHSYGVDAGRIALTVDVDGELDIELAIPCGLIINELLSNSLKHAFPGQRNGTVLIRFHRHGDSFVLHFADDGVGLAASVDFRRTESLGLQLVTTLTRQIGGMIERLPRGGTCFEIGFPAPLRRPE
jgi:PAS domain S-box-containing protein